MIKIAYIRTYLHRVSNSSVVAVPTQFSKVVYLYVVPTVGLSIKHQNLPEH